MFDTQESHAGFPKSNPREERQLGAVVIFREGVTREQVEAALKLIANVTAGTPHVNGFNPEWGSPVWYIP
jgi:hypothetical protein